MALLLKWLRPSDASTMTNEASARSSRSFHIAAVAVIVAYLVTAFILVDDYGITWDEPADFGIGHKYLHWYQTGHLDFYDEHPIIAGHPDFYVSWVRKAQYILWPTANILSAMSCWLFFQKLGIYDPIAAHHIFVPLLVAGLLYALYRFVARHWQPQTGLIAILILITFPRFFGHTFNNIKDIPALVFLSLTILAYAQWTHTSRKRWLVAAFVAWWFALTTKVDTVMVVPLLILWQLPNIVTALRERQTIMLSTLLVFSVGIVLVSIAYFAAFPPVSPIPDSAEDLKFIARHLRYAALRGTAGHSVAVHGSSGGIAAISDWTTFSVLGEKVWNLRSIVLVSLTVPITMGIAFLTGSFVALRKYRSPMYLLLLVWVAVPILRHCLPTLLLYDGIRLFLWFIVPFSVLAAIGVERIARAATERFALRGTISILVLTILVVAPNVSAIISTHPYQTTYTNMLHRTVDKFGIWRSRLQNLNFADYWMNSYKEASAWLDENASPNSHIAAYPVASTLEYYFKRQDLRAIWIHNIDQDMLAAGNLYMVVIPTSYKGYDRVRELIAEMTLVHQITRQGREIASIYHKSGNSADDDTTTGFREKQ